MKKTFQFLLAGILLSLSTYSQKTPIDLTFTGIHPLTFSSLPCRLDSVRVENLTQGCDTSLYWPDTVLVIRYAGLADGQVPGCFTMYPAVPNPCTEEASVRIFVPEPGRVDIRVSDITGRPLLSAGDRYGSGYHTFLFRAGKEKIYLITACYRDRLLQQKLISAGHGNGSTCRLEYSETHTGTGSGKLLDAGFAFNPGDSLLVSGYSEGLKYYLRDAPVASKTYLLFFGMNFPCPGGASFSYGGQIYHTVQIGNQCWMRENLNIGVMVVDDHLAGPHTHCSNNGIIEKYCYNNDTALCTIYGGLYDWNEMMDYHFQQGVQGICPAGWHVPSNDEWCALGIFLDSTVTCSGYHVFTGTDAGGKMKEPGIGHWNSPNLGATNESGFTGLGGGYRFSYGSFFLLREDGRFWSSTDYQLSNGVMFLLAHDFIQFYRDWIPKEDGHSVRCVRNE